MKKKPNILLITTDQQRFDTISANGATFMHTPNLDRLASEGCCFRNAYSPNPVCIPARHNLLTGLSARFHGYDDNYFVNPPPIPYELPTFAQILTDHGYDAMGIGKMHFLPCRRHNGFTNLQLMEEIPLFREDDDYAVYLKELGYGNYRSFHGVRHLLYMQPQQSFLPEAHHGTHWVADRTIAYLRQNAGKRPFMVWASFIAPHPPFDVPERFANLYKGKIPPPAQTVTPLSAIAQENRGIADYPSDDYLTRVRELYHGAISFVDENIGRILDTLVELGELNNTLIIFTSDHGEMLGELGTYQKFLPYDGAAKIPMIIRYPERLAANRVQEQFVDLNDLLPTMLDVVGVDYPGTHKLPGESIFTAKGTKDRTHQYMEYSKGNRRWISMRDHRYKYNYYYGGGYEELYDLQNDPHETTNLLATSPTAEQQAARNDLRQRLTAMEKAYGLEGYVQENQLIKLDAYKINYYRETNYPKHLAHLSADERAGLVSIEDEILLATQREPVVQLEDLDLETFARHSGLSHTAIDALLYRKQSER